MKHTSSDWLHEKPKKLSPKEYKRAFFAIYKKRADERGVKFEPRNFKKIENGFCFDYARERENKRDLISSTFWWHYSDHIVDSFFARNYLLEKILKSP